MLPADTHGRLAADVTTYKSSVMSVSQVLEMRIPFLLSSIKDFQQHVPNGQDSMVRLRLFLMQCLSQSSSVSSCAVTDCDHIAPASLDVA